MHIADRYLRQALDTYEMAAFLSANEDRGAIGRALLARVTHTTMQASTIQR